MATIDFRRRLNRGFWSIVLSYAAVGTTWILTTDYLVARSFDFSSEARRIEVAKGLFYVFATATLLLVLLMRLKRVLLRTLEDRYAVRQRLAAVTESPLLGIAVWDSEGKIVETNDTFLRMWGYTRAQFEAESPGFQQLSPPENLDRDRECLASAVRDGIPGPYVKEILRRDGTRLPVLTGVTAKSPQATEGLLFLVDDSERRAATQALERLLQEMEDRVAERTRDLSLANSDLEAFGYSISHDLRAPLRTIDGMTSLLEAELEPAQVEARRAAERIHNGVRRMSGIIDSLMRLATVSRQPLVRQDVDVAAMVREIATELTESSGRQVGLKVEEPMIVNGDPGLLRVVFRNLLENAWKFTMDRPDPHVEVLIDSTMLTIRDNGHGFDSGTEEQLFRPFSQGAHRPNVEGSGIGLAIVERIVRGHGWSIEAQGTPDQGAAFVIRFNGTRSGQSLV